LPDLAGSWDQFRTNQAEVPRTLLPIGILDLPDSSEQYDTDCILTIIGSVNWVWNRLITTAGHAASEMLDVVDGKTRRQRSCTTSLFV